MKKVLLTLILAASLCSVQAGETKEKPIADETFITSSENSVKVVCSNQTIGSMIVIKFDETILRYTVVYKKDRFGRYKEYTIYFKKEDEKTITDYLKSL